MILKEIKKERKEKVIKPYINKAPELIKAERRLIIAINAVIKSNNSLKREFTKNNKLEAQIEGNRKAESRNR